MAEVYAARKVGDGRGIVALKLLAASVAEGDAAQAELRAGLEAAARIDHPAVVRIHEIGREGDTTFVASELVHGATLAACARGGARASVGVALRIVDAIATGVGAAHQRGVLHEDLSPQNVLVGYDGVVKVADFGYGHRAALERARTDAGHARASYLAPEQIKRRPADARTDVFAIGVIAWELLAGARLFARDTPAATYQAILEAPVPDLASLTPEVPRAVVDVLASALAREPGDRFENVEALRRAPAGARAASESPAADVARWARAAVPPGPSPEELAAEITSSGTSAPPRAAPAATDVPDLVIPSLGTPFRPAPASSAAPAPSATPASSAAAPALPPPSVRTRAAAPVDDDDGDMEIERNLVSPAAGMGGGAIGRASSPGAEPRAGARGGSGLEISHVRSTSRSHADDDDDEPSAGARVVGLVAATVLAGAAAAGLFRVAYRPGGVSVTRLLPHAFDGSSAPESGVVSLVALALAVAVGFAGVKSSPRSWSMVGSGGALLLLALAMVTVTLASTGDNPTPPDGVLLVPYLLPAAVLLFSLGVAGRAGVLFARGGVARRLGAVPVALLAGALGFLAFAISRFA